MAEQHDLSFGDLLRYLRSQERLTQEELAEKASVSLRAISDLERGVNLTARKETTRLLADALKLSGATRAEFESAARGGPADRSTVIGRPEAEGHRDPESTPRLPYDLRHFTGRDSDLAQLMQVVTADGGVVGIYAIDGMAGVGKSAFAIHAAYMLAPQFPDGQIFLPLRAHASGQKPVDASDALASLLLSTGFPAQQIPAGLHQRSALWRAHLSGRRMLLILDDAAGHDQVRPLLPEGSESLVLITSRRHLSALDNVTSICLDTFLPDDAVTMLIRVADRADLDPDDPAAGKVARLCGYLPLAIGMMARQLHHHPVWTLAGLADDLAATRDRLELMHAENLSVAVAFDLSYQDLDAHQKRLLRRLGLNPGTDIGAHAAAALDDSSQAAARRGLDELFDQHLVIEPASGRYRLHDLIREWASALASADDPQDREQAVTRLLDYYVSAAMAADRLFSGGVGRVGGSWTGFSHPGRTRAVDRLVSGYQRPGSTAPEFTDYGTALAWLDAERSNLLACADHAAAHGDDERLIRLAGVLSAYLAHVGLWDQAMTIHAAACAAAGRSGDWLGHANSLANLGWVRYLAGDNEGAHQALAEARGLYHAMGRVLDEADVLVNVGTVRWLQGDFDAATENLEEARWLYLRSSDRLGQADALRILGKVQRETAQYDAAILTLDEALSIYREFSDGRREADALTDLGSAKRLTGKLAEAESLLEEALSLYEAIDDRRGEATALVQMGAVCEQTGDYEKALRLSEEALAIIRSIGGPSREADTMRRAGVILRRMGSYQQSILITRQGLAIFRAIGSRIGQADALNDLGTALRASGQHDDAGAALREALDLYTGAGGASNQHGEAEILNQLGALHLAAGNAGAASECHARALAASRSVGIPVEEARSLEGLARCQQCSGDDAAAIAGLSEALDIYQRIGAPEAASVAAELAMLADRAAGEQH